MKTLDQNSIKKALGDLRDESPSPREFETIVSHELALETKKARPTESNVGSAEQSVFLVPFVPDELTLSSSEVLDAAGNATGEAARSYQTYLPLGQDTWVEGDRVVLVSVFDVLSMNRHLIAEGRGDAIRDSECSGDAAIAAGVLDFGACWNRFIETAIEMNGEDSLLTNEPMSVRGNPAYIAEILFTTEEGLTDHYFYISTHEGGGVMSEVVAHQYDRSTAIEIAESLQAVPQAEFPAVGG